MAGMWPVVLVSDGSRGRRASKFQDQKRVDGLVRKEKGSWMVGRDFDGPMIAGDGKKGGRGSVLV